MRAKSLNGENTRSHARRFSDDAWLEMSTSTVTPRPFVHCGVPETQRGNEVVIT